MDGGTILVPFASLVLGKSNLNSFHLGNMSFLLLDVPNAQMYFILDWRVWAESQRRLRTLYSFRSWVIE